MYIYTRIYAAANALIYLLWDFADKHIHIGACLNFSDVATL